MGIKGLFPFIRGRAPRSIRESQLKAYTGRHLAIDASGWLYQFLAAVRTGAAAEHLQNADGQATSHVQGFLNRAIRMLEAGVQPVFVFDGKPPAMKADVNKARREARAAAASELADAIEEEADAEQVYKAASRSTLVTREHNAMAKELLRHMGLPVVEAPGEAEATCAQLCRLGRVYASVTEDMDVLTFGSPRQVKNLFDVEGARVGQGPRPAYEIELAAVLDGLGCSMDCFIDFCILSGCDYLPHLPRMGSKTAFKLLETELSLAGVVSSIEEGRAPKGITIPDDWDWSAAKALFLEAASELEPAKALDMTASVPDYDAVRAFLVDRNQFSGTRVDAALTKLRKVYGGSSGGSVSRQKPLDMFFKPVPSPVTVKMPAKPAVAQHPKRDWPNASVMCSPPKRAKCDDGEPEERPSAVRTASPVPEADELPGVPSLHPVALPGQPLAPLHEVSSAIEAEVSGLDDGVTWNCERCTFANDALLPYCELCDAPRASRPSAGEPSAGASSSSSGPMPFAAAAAAAAGQVSEAIKLDRRQWGVSESSPGCTAPLQPAAAEAAAHTRPGASGSGACASASSTGGHAPASPTLVGGALPQVEHSAPQPTRPSAPTVAFGARLEGLCRPGPPVIDLDD